MIVEVVFGSVTHDACSHAKERSTHTHTHKIVHQGVIAQWVQVSSIMPRHTVNDCNSQQPQKVTAAGSTAPGLKPTTAFVRFTRLPRPPTTLPPVILPNGCLNMLIKDLLENKIFSLLNQEF